MGNRRRRRRPNWTAVGKVITFLLGTAEQLTKVIGSARGLW
jgi:hypothetical protein